jgi:hypothetical protein
MAIIGNIIKGAIEIGGKLSQPVQPQAGQKKVLRELLEKAKHTAFGNHYGFEEILSAHNPAEKFAASVPFFDYHSMEEKWWKRVHAGENDVCWPGAPEYFALSSGTTGTRSKRIPVTKEVVECIRKAGIKQVLSLKNFDLPPDFFEKEILMLGSSTRLKENHGKLEGEISGISAANIPFWFQGYYKPGEHIAAIDDWDAKVQKIAEEADKWDIGALSGIPSWIELMLEKVIDYHNLNNIHEIWPHLQVYTSGGVAFEPYEKSFDKLMGKPITVIDTYLASEGYLATQTRPHTDSMQLLTDNGIYFEFVPFKPDYINEDGSLKAEVPVTDISGVEEGEDYVLIISTVSGAWRYLIGDTVAFTDIDRAEIKITGRTKFFLNTVGSQLSVNKMDAAIQAVQDQFNTSIPEYTICAKRGEDGEFYHFWYVGSEDPLEDDKVAKALDEHLQEANKNYRVARSKALKGVKVKVVKPERFYAWNDRNKKKGGQVKMERVMQEEKFKEWEGFVKEI